MMGPMGGPKPLQAWGFVAIGTCSILVAVLYHGGEDVAPWKRWGAFAACCCLIFSLNWGCNVSTYVLPMEIYPRALRSTFHGWSAGLGKCGAALGMCCLIGVCITHVFIDPPRENTFWVKEKQESDRIPSSTNQTSIAFSPLPVTSDQTERFLHR
eukprot:scaffold280108_cov44-Attheya_sp.AAC.2